MTLQMEAEEGGRVRVEGHHSRKRVPTESQQHLLESLQRSGVEEKGRDERESTPKETLRQAEESVLDDRPWPFSSFSNSGHASRHKVGLKHSDAALKAALNVRIDKILEGKPQLRSLGYPHYDDAPIQNEVVMLSSTQPKQEIVQKGMDELRCNRLLFQ